MNILGHACTNSWHAKLFAPEMQIIQIWLSLTLYTLCFHPSVLDIAIENITLHYYGKEFVLCCGLANNLSLMWKPSEIAWMVRLLFWAINLLQTVLTLQYTALLWDYGLLVQTWETQTTQTWFKFSYEQLSIYIFCMQLVQLFYVDSISNKIAC